MKIVKKKIVKKGICAKCGRGPRNIAYLHPQTRESICITCYRKLTGRSLPKKGICPECGRGPKNIGYRHPVTGKNICTSCHHKRRIQLSEWFRELSVFTAAGWIVDTTITQDPARIKSLNILVEQEPEKVKETLTEIFESPLGVARRIIQQFLETAEGEKLKGL